MNNLSVNVYGLTDTNKVQIVKISNKYKNDDLYFASKEKSQNASIKNLSKLIKSQLNNGKCKTYPLSSDQRHHSRR